MNEKIPCIKCNKEILPTTSKKFNGLCGPCFTEKSKDDECQENLSTPGCPSCDGSNYIRFKWETDSLAYKAQDPNVKYKKYIKEIKKLKYGFLSQCSICHGFWYCDKNQFQNVISSEYNDILAKWNESKNFLSLKLALRAFFIKPTPPDRYGSIKDNITIPCAITTVDNVYYPKAKLVITEFPPLEVEIEKIKFANQIKSMQSSPFALPFKVRKAILMAEEVRMGFFPTIVYSKSGAMFILNKTSDFFDHDGIKGEDIALTTNIANDSIEPIHINEDKDVHYFFADSSWISKFFKCYFFHGNR